MKKSEIINRIFKLRKLQQQGVGGERDNAEKLLNELMNKYGITEQDLAQDDSEEIAYFFNSQGYGWLLVQVAGKTVGFDRLRGGRVSDILPKHMWKDMIRNDKSIKDCDFSFLCTKAEMLEINMLFDIYLQDYKKKEINLQYAYLGKNDLLAPASNGVRKKNEELDMAQIAKFSQGISKKEVHKALQEHED